jgi:hypothetical protein
MQVMPGPSSRPAYWTVSIFFDERRRRRPRLNLRPVATGLEQRHSGTICPRHGLHCEFSYLPEYFAHLTGVGQDAGHPGQSGVQIDFGRFDLCTGRFRLQWAASGRAGLRNRPW